ncbi:ubiquitin carboxyl-terminal hydrolase MINDY-2 isoform X4 [Anguilla rostrata]|uniref:ubiquitin carboxyl-terminal hydrolase MINDY-2 isoform X4 n=1 Tax=Anguilla rostrata TaxID=7938 RepID=UPI0030D0E4F9
MEKNANLHRDLGEGAPCSTISGESGGIKVTEVVKGATDSCKNSEPSTLSTLVSSSASSPLSASTANAVTGETKSDVGLETAGPLPVQNIITKPSDCSETSSSELRDQLSNGMGHSLLLAPGNGEGATSKLVNNRADGDPPSMMEESTARITNIQAGVAKCGSQEPAKISPPTSLCPNKTSLKSAKPGGLDCSDHVVSEGPPTESDPSPAGESRSYDSLESFSNLNSCPSSDLNSEGMEDSVLAIALQSDEYGADEAKVSCSKDRGAGQSIYHIKWIKWKEENTPIITQNENGPCPLLAIMNVLLLAWKVKMPPMMEIITAEQLMEYLGDYILDAKPKEISEAQRLNYEQAWQSSTWLCLWVTVTSSSHCKQRIFDSTKHVYFHLRNFYISQTLCCPKMGGYVSYVKVLYNKCCNFYTVKSKCMKPLNKSQECALQPHVNCLIKKSTIVGHRAK